MPSPASAAGPGVLGFAEHLKGLRRRLVERGDSSSDAVYVVPGGLAADLETAYEELHVADEEVRAQQEQIAGLHEVQDRLHREHERMVSLLPVAAVLTDSAGLIRSVNAAAALLLRARVARIVGKPVFSLFAIEDRSALRAMMRWTGGPDEQRHRASLVSQAVVPVVIEISASRHAETGDVSWMLLPEGDDAARLVALPAALSRLAALPTRGRDEREVLHEAAEICLAAMPTGGELSLTVGSPLDPQFVTSTARVAQQMDAAEMRAAQGPCIDAFDNRVLVVCDDVRSDLRWPRLQPLLPEGVIAVVAAPIEVGSRLVGVLNVYGTSISASIQLVESIELLAATLGAVLYEMDLNAELNTLSRDMTQALDSRALIEQAKGIVMADRRCGPDEAFLHLAQLSSVQERKLRDVARELVEQVTDGR